MRIPLAPLQTEGLLVVVSGVDGAGKTTVVEGTAARLAAEGYDVVMTRQPTAWWRNEPRVVKSVFQQGEVEPMAPEAVALLAIADRLDHQIRVLLPELRRGAVILSDRYTYSLVGYYMADQSLDLAPLVRACEQLVAPHVAFLMDVQPELALERVLHRDGARPGQFDQRADFVRRSIEAFRVLAAENGLHRLDASMPPEYNISQVLSQIPKERCTRRNRQGRIRRL